MYEFVYSKEINIIRKRSITNEKHEDYNETKRDGNGSYGVRF